MSSNLDTHTIDHVKHKQQVSLCKQFNPLTSDLKKCPNLESGLKIASHVSLNLIAQT